MKEHVFLSNNKNDIVEDYWIMHCCNATNVLINRLNCSGSTFILTLFLFEEFCDTCEPYSDVIEVPMTDRAVGIGILMLYRDWCRHKLWRPNSVELTKWQKYKIDYVTAIAVKGSLRNIICFYCFLSCLK